jgi:hypothetical protein
MTTKICTKCGVEKPVDDFYRLSTKSDARHPWCKSCERARKKTPKYKAYARAYSQTRNAKALQHARQQSPDYSAVRRSYSKTPEGRFYKTRSNARRRSIVFTITLEEWLKEFPTPGDRCRICLREMVDGYWNRGSGPSPDRRDNSRGYESGNVQFICDRCNALKRDADANTLHRLGLYSAGLLGPLGPAPTSDLTTEPASATL